MFKIEVWRHVSYLFLLCCSHLPGTRDCFPPKGGVVMRAYSGWRIAGLIYTLIFGKTYEQADFTPWWSNGTAHSHSQGVKYALSRPSAWDATLKATFSVGRRRTGLSINYNVIRVNIKRSGKVCRERGDVALRAKKTHTGRAEGEVDLSKKHRAFIQIRISPRAPKGLEPESVGIWRVGIRLRWIRPWIISVKLFLEMWAKKMFAVENSSKNALE